MAVSLQLFSRNCKLFSDSFLCILFLLSINDSCFPLPCRVPEHFEWTSMAAATGNWAIAVGNLKSIVKSLEAYYHGVLGKRVVDLDTLDCKAIARNNDTDELLNLLELVIGVAILCEHKARHIQEIFSLGQETQTELKVLIECVMGRLSDVDADAEVGEAEGEGFSASASASASTSAQGEAGGDTEAGTVAELKEERRRLLASMQTLESANSGLEAQVEALALEVQGLSESQSHGQGHGGSGSGSGAGAGAGAGDATAALQQQLFDCRRELDDRTLELESAGAELQGLHALLSTARQMQSKSELEVQMAADKLELATETQVRLTQAEALLEKYKRRLEELPQLRHESKESAAKLDEYIERCHNLEAGNAKLSQLLEASGVRSGELERRGMRGEAEVTTLREELAGVREELEREQAARRVSEVDAKDARAEMVELKAAAEVAIASAHDNAEVAVEREMVSWTAPLHQYIYWMIVLPISCDLCVWCCRIRRTTNSSSSWLPRVAPVRVQVLISRVRRCGCLRQSWWR